jgi:hypothetical protein
MIINPPRVSEIKETIIAIVRFGPPSDNDGLRAGEYYQVCINPYNFSQCGTFIRFGHHPGDEITGWQRADCLYVVSELYKVPAGIAQNQIAIPWGISPALAAPGEILQ